MANMIASDYSNLIVGAGVTGQSAARYCEKQGIAYRVFDTRKDPAIAAPFKQLNNEVAVGLGEYDASILEGVKRIVLSPGVSRSELVVQDALARNIEVVSDITLFLERANAPVVGITGTNGKSTVTTMMGLVAETAGIKVGVGGNLGTPALDLLEEGIELYVLELSSFQLESTDNAELTVSVNLNVSQDHLDRHGSLNNYFQAKQKIFHGAKSVIYNLEDLLTQPPIVDGVKRFGFGRSEKTEKNEVQFTLDPNGCDLVRDGESLLSRSDVKLKGVHNLENVLAVLAICEALGISFEYVSKVAADFTGLPHRCEFVVDHNGITYINDSKATNVGAAVSALDGFASDFSNIVLIAGGVGKGQDFKPLGEALVRNSIDLVLIGEDAELIRSSLPSKANLTCVGAHSLSSALGKATTLLEEYIEGSKLVLFSPACASFDMFKNFEVRGEAFKGVVETMVRESIQ